MSGCGLSAPRPGDEPGALPAPRRASSGSKPTAPRRWPNAYAEAWATVLPAPDEAFGLVLLESLAAGTPVVAARAGGPAELVDDPRLGRLFEPDDEAGLIEALAASLEMSRSDGVAEACRRRAAKFSWDKLVVRYERLYEEVVGGGSVGSDPRDIQGVRPPLRGSSAVE